MTYKDVLDDLTDIFRRHHMIQTWGYGNLSDLVAPFKRDDTTGTDSVVYNIDYPYAFLQPTTHNLAKGKSTFSFNLIMMEQCDEETIHVVQAQSNCYQYIQDVLAEIYYNYDQKFDFTLNSSVIPFKEKYDDTVSGMTAQITLEIPMVLDDCLAPFEPKGDIPTPPPAGILTLSVEKDSDQTFSPDEYQSPIVFQTVLVDLEDGWRPDAKNFYTPQVAGTWTWELEGTTEVITDRGEWPSAPQLFDRTQGGGSIPVDPTTTTWPSTQPDIGVITPFKCTWSDYAITPNGDFIAWNWANQPATEDKFRIKQGTTLKGYFTAS